MTRQRDGGADDEGDVEAELLVARETLRSASQDRRGTCSAKFAPAMA